MTRCGWMIGGLLAGLAGVAWSAEPWVVYEGGDGPGQGKQIVFVTGDDEYRSEEGMPMLAKILAVRHGFRCTVLFAIDPKTDQIKPDHQTNIPGLEALRSADMMVLFLRFRELPDEQMKHIIEFTDRGRPILGLRTATHAFAYRRNRNSPFSRFTYDSQSPRGGYGAAVLGDTWLNHHGAHGRESTRGLINPKHKAHPILTGVEDVWGPTDVYSVRPLPKDATVLVHGQVIAGMKPTDPPVKGDKNNPLMPLVWTRAYHSASGKTARIICTTMGASVDLQSTDLRRLLVNACYWGVGLEDRMPVKADVRYVGQYQPTFFGFGKHVPGVKPADLKLR